MFAMGTVGKKHSSVAEERPSLLKKWHPRNTLDPNEVSASSGKKVWLICERDHEWEATIASLNRDNVHCPYCYGRKVCVDNCLATLNPELSKQWHETKNGITTPFDVTLGSNKQVWWKCSKNHEWRCSTKERKKNNCPFCSGRRVARENSLAEVFPNLADEWNHARNGKGPEQYTAFSGERVWWKCSKDGSHEWEAIVANRSKAGTGCPYCNHKFPTNDTSFGSVAPNDLLEEWHPLKNELTPSDVLPFSKAKVWWRCKRNAAHEWEASVSNRHGSNTGCPYCCQNHTLLEKEFERLFNLPKFDKKALENSSYRPDFKLSSDVFVNVDGLYWHNEGNKGRSYHLKLRESFEAEGKTLLQFYEDEIRSQNRIVKSIVENKIGMTKERIFARRCETKEIDATLAKEFLQENHLMGFYKFGKHVGLFKGSELVAVMTYRFVLGKGIAEIARFAGKLDVSIVGGFGKLLSFLERTSLEQGISKIVSFCDLRYGSGASYRKLGFLLERTTQGWCWSDGKERFNRLKCTACKDADGSHVSEADHAKRLKWFKIFDAGQAKYVKRLMK